MKVKRIIVVVVFFVKNFMTAFALLKNLSQFFTLETRRKTFDVHIIYISVWSVTFFSEQKFFFNIAHT